LRKILGNAMGLLGNMENGDLNVAQQMEHDLKYLTRELIDNKTSSEKNAQQITEVSLRYNVLKDQYFDLQGLYQQLLEDNKTIKKENENLKQENSMLKGKLEILQKSIHDLTEEYKALSKAYLEDKFNNELQDKAFDLNTLYIHYFIEPHLDSFTSYIQWKGNHHNLTFSDYVADLDADIKEGVKIVTQVDVIFNAIGFSWKEISELYMLRQKRNKKTHSPYKATVDQRSLITTVSAMLKDSRCIDANLSTQLKHYITQLNNAHLKRWV